MSSPSPGASLTLGDGALELDLAAGMESVETLLRQTVKSDYPFVTETSRHLVEAGGKRLRPLLLLLAAHFGDPSAARVVPAAVAVELTHLATLYHDDVMDEALVRRGAETVSSRWTNTIAILTGDFLFARASEITADLGTEATRILARTLAVLCEGQIRETVGPAEGADAIEHYLLVAAEKTASLIASSARLGALLSGAEPAVVDVLTRYGEILGVAFQVSDDLLDVTGSAAESGKLPGTDLREGIATLPVLYALRAGGEDVTRLQALLAAPLDDDGTAEALGLLRRSPGLDRARAGLLTQVRVAREALTGLPEGSPRAALEAVADFLVTRTG